MDKGLTGSEIAVRALEEAGTEVVFGIPGGTVIPLYDALYGSEIRHVLARHEQGACFEAAGYARASGKVGVCLATSGPGALNTLTALADSYADSVPLVLITGQVGGAMKGSDAFQEADLFGSSLSMVKHSFVATDPGELRDIVLEAFEMASFGRPGPVLIDLSVDVQRGRCDIDSFRKRRPGGGRSVMEADAAEILSVSSLLDRSERPVVLAGGGVISSGASESLRLFAEIRSIPVATSLMGKGAFPEGNPLSLGMAGMHGTERANSALAGCDLVMALGCRFSDRTTCRTSGFARNASVVQIDMDRAEIGKNVGVNLGLLADVRRALDILNGEEAPRSFRAWSGSLVPSEIDSSGDFSPREIIRAIRGRLNPDDVVTTEVGQHQMWGALHWRTDMPRKFLSSGGQGTMGFGLPAAIGAAVALPGRPVVCLAGDGSFLMNSQEMDTAVRHDLPVKVVIFNNGSLGMVRQWQELFWGRRYSSTVERPRCDFVSLAFAYGARGFRAETLAELEGNLEDFLFGPGPAIMECPIRQEEKVFPMVPAGKDIGEFLLGT